MTDAASGNLHMLSKCMAVRSYGFVVFFACSIGKKTAENRMRKRQVKKEEQAGHSSGASKLREVAISGFGQTSDFTTGKRA